MKGNLYLWGLSSGRLMYSVSGTNDKTKYYVISAEYGLKVGNYFILLRIPITLIGWFLKTVNRT